MEPLKLGQIRQRNGNNEISIVMKNHEKEKRNNKDDELQYYHFKVAVIILVFIASPIFSPLSLIVQQFLAPRKFPIATFIVTLQFAPPWLDSLN